MRSIFTNDKIIMIIVFLNAIVIFMSGFDFSPNFLTHIDNVFTLLFIIEVIAKISKFGLSPYFSSGWNRFDFIITLVGAVSLISLFANTSIGSLSVILSVRILRVFKSFRLIKFIPNISALLRGVQRAIRSSFIIVISFLLMIFVVSILSHVMFGNISSTYFGNPMISFYSIFRLFSIEGWYEIPNAIAENMPATAAVFVKLYFSILLFIGGILGLSLVNSIFVDAMVSDNNDEVLEHIKLLEKKIDNLKK